MSKRVICDPIHGMIEINDLQQDLLNQPELQRLAWIMQLGFVKLVFPGANHKRLEHCLGVSHISGQIADQLELSMQEKKYLQGAGLLHDLGHPPLSHILEIFLNKSHEEISRDIIIGSDPFNMKNGGEIPRILEKHGLDPKLVAGLVTKQEKSYLSDIVHGEIDADRLDYLNRDSHYTGVSHGVIGANRLITTMRLKDGKICVLEKGVRSVEELLISREQMYSSVYFHHVSRIAELMLQKAMKPVVSEIPDFYMYNDYELLEKLRSMGGYQKETVDRLIFRKLFKRAFVLGKADLIQYRLLLDGLAKLTNSQIEEKISYSSGVNRKDIIIDFPRRDFKNFKTYQDKGKILNTPILRKNGQVVSISEISNIAKSLGNRKSDLPIFSVYTPKEYMHAVKKAVRGILF